MYRELNAFLVKLRPKSPHGPDGIPYQAFRNIPEPFKHRLLAKLNVVWEAATIPNIWKTAWVLVIFNAWKPTFDRVLIDRFPLCPA